VIPRVHSPAAGIDDEMPSYTLARLDAFVPFSFQPCLRGLPTPRLFGLRRVLVSATAIFRRYPDGAEPRAR
jgi:hypothetical protein